MTRRRIRAGSITVLPDEILETIAIQSSGQDLRAWCRLATTCKRLWTLQLPSFLHGHRLGVAAERKETSAMLFQRA